MATELDGLVSARQKLESQQQENKGVQTEFAALDDDANIYKLIGPVLLKQDRGEAVRTVEGRLEFIEKEMYVPACSAIERGFLSGGSLTGIRRQQTGRGSNPRG